LVSHISYDPPASGGLDTADVSFEYDAVGNRKLMTDGSGSQSYNYNQLSQLMSETRTKGGGIFTQVSRDHYRRNPHPDHSKTVSTALA
jgi:YD repeat-containing protein